LFALRKEAGWEVPVIAVPPASRGEVDELASPHPRLVFENIDL
jgi:hypothetical protein